MTLALAMMPLPLILAAINNARHQGANSGDWFLFTTAMVSCLAAAVASRAVLVVHGDRLDIRNPVRRHIVPVAAVNALRWQIIRTDSPFGRREYLTPELRVETQWIPIRALREQTLYGELPRGSATSELLAFIAARKGFTQPRYYTPGERFGGRFVGAEARRYTPPKHSWRVLDARVAVVASCWLILAVVLAATG